MTDIPPGWETTTLGDIAETSLGKMLDRGKGSGKHFVPYLRNINVQWGAIDTSDVREMDIPPHEQEYFRLRAGDLLVCEGGDIGRCAVWRRWDGYMAFQKALHRVRPFGGIDVSYLRYYMEHLQLSGGLSQYATGSTIKHISQAQLRLVRVVVPPLAEQRRIVAAAEDYFSRLETAGDLLRLGELRLTGMVESVRSRGVIHALGIVGSASSGSIEWGTLRDVLEGIEAGKSFACEPRPANPGEWGVIKVSAMTWGEFREGENKAVPPHRSFNPSHEIQEGDILVSRANTPAYVGAPVLVGDCRPRLLLSDKSLRLEPKPHIHPLWLIEVLSSRGVRRQITALATGTKESMRNISQEALLGVRIPLAPPGCQRVVAATIGEVLEFIRRTQAAITDAKRRQANLRNAILADAFAGRLVPQDPGDEPATVLLERIRHERAAQPKRRGRRAVTPQKEVLL